MKGDKKMVRKVERILWGIVAILSLFTIMGWAGYLESTYNMQGTVLHKQNETLAIEDARGHIWFYESDTYGEGDVVSMVLYDNHTHSVYDDEIIKLSLSKKHNQ